MTKKRLTELRDIILPCLMTRHGEGENAIDELIDEIERLRKLAPAWHSVDEDPPETGHYLVVTEDCGDPREVYWGTVNGERGWDSPYCITHWRVKVQGPIPLMDCFTDSMRAAMDEEQSDRPGPEVTT